MVMEPILQQQNTSEKGMEMLKDVSKILTISVKLLISEHIWKPTPKKSRPNDY